MRDLRQGVMQKRVKPFYAVFIASRIKIDVDDRILFPFPVKGIDGKRRPPPGPVKKVPPAPKKGVQALTEQGLPEAPGAGKENRACRAGYKFVYPGAFIDITVTVFADFREILYTDG